MLNTWLPDPEIDPNLMPNYASHYIGVGGLLVNSRDEILVVAEKYSFRKTHKLMWKLPGGLVDPYERISTAAEREVFEETGMAMRLSRFVQLNVDYYFCFPFSQEYDLDSSILVAFVIIPSGFSGKVTYTLSAHFACLIHKYQNQNPTKKVINPLHGQLDILLFHITACALPLCRTLRCKMDKD